MKTIAEGVEKGNIIYNKVWRTNAGMIVIEINNTVVGMRINVLPSILYSDIETYRLYIKEKTEQ